MATFALRKRKPPPHTHRMTKCVGCSYGTSYRFVPTNELETFLSNAGNAKCY